MPSPLVMKKMVFKNGLGNFMMLTPPPTPTLKVHGVANTVGRDQIEIIT